ncbi:MAG: hypothetical protein RLZZ15_1587 [Verrucomicrobiota bacterium]
MPFLRFLLCALAGVLTAHAARPSILILDGRNNHDWRTTTDSLRATLESTGLFTVEVATAPELRTHSGLRAPATPDETFAAAQRRHADLTRAAQTNLAPEWDRWSPDFSKHAAVILNYNGPAWPRPMQDAFVAYVRGGGGVLVVHAANNGFADWPEFNAMIGLGWRKGDFGTCLTIDPATGRAVECCAGEATGHGAKHPFVVTHRQPGHPILHGLPTAWLHGKDELYHHLRGPAQNVTILASAFSDPQQRGSGRHEPVLWEVPFGQGRVLVCTLGHSWKGDTDWDGLRCVGFQTVLARSAEYLTTGKVTLDAPKNFPATDRTSIAWPHTLALPAASASAPAPDWQAKKKTNLATVLTPEEERASFALPPGYVAELVAAEPLVEQPVLAVWDADGAMYVAEMRSYMQDEAGTGTKSLRNGRIKRLTSSRRDGIMDRATVFVDGLNLPRMILPLLDGIAVVETDDTSVWHYRDLDGNGVAEEKTLLFKGRAGDGTRSVEHQDSGLDWNLDNWIYVSYGRERYRFTDGTWRAQPTHPIWTQWGVTHDDTGRVFFSDNSSPAMGFQLPRPYWSLIQKRSGDKPRSGEPISLGLAWDMDFLSAKNLCPVDDRGGPAPARKIFTSICGQSVFRGDALPFEARGDYFFCDPTIHVVRRAKLTDRNGRLTLSNPHGDDEFLLSPDILFRPVNTATGPDGALTVVDMYRGIIQDAPWLSEGPRKFIRESGLATVNHLGRIWRLRHRDLAPTAAPHMSRETTAELLRHLEHPNGWWRDTAQRQIILRPDRATVAPALADLARYHDNPLTRLHALWTLEGLAKIDAPLVTAALVDRDPRVRAASARLGEPFLEKNDSAFFSALTTAAKIERVPEVAKQFILSLAFFPDTVAATPAMDDLIERHVAHEGVFLAACTVFWKKPSPYLARIQSGDALLTIKDPARRAEVAARWTQGFAQWQRQLDLPADLPPEQRALLTKGAETYFETCVSCHGPDGKGVAVPGSAELIAPSLAGSARVRGPAAGLVPVLLHGLTGPIAGRTYQGAMMVPAATLGITRDDRLAELLSFIRHAWGNEAPPITKDDVRDFRRTHEKRTAAWTDDELNQFTR